MTGALRHMTTLLRRFWKDDSGAPTIEFVILFPFLIGFLFSLGEVGALMVRSVLIDRGVDMAVRDLRIGAIANPTHAALKQRICAGAMIFSDCEKAIHIELTPLAGLGAFPVGPYTCADRTLDVEPMVSFQPGKESEIMVMKVCMIVNPLFPGTGVGAMLPKDATGGYAIVTSTAFVNEPG